MSNSNNSNNFLKADTLLNELVEWVGQHKGDVDRRTFEGACMEIDFYARQHTNLRKPRGLPEGLPTLDLACALLRRYDAQLLASQFPSLPGAKYFQGEGQA